MDSIRWAELQGTIRRAEEALEKGRLPAAAETGTILDRRARLLAEEAEGSGETERGERLDLVLFRLAGEHYAVECRHVMEVAPLKALAPIPGTPPFIAGVTNIRGRILDVVDLKAFFELPPQGLSDLTRVIVLQGKDTEFGLLAEAVSGTLTVRSGDLQGPLPTMTGIRSEFLRGVAPGGEIVLDGLRLLTDPRLVVNEDRQGESAC